jgi:hypothetical protein
MVIKYFIVRDYHPSVLLILFVILSVCSFKELILKDFQNLSWIFKSCIKQNANLLTRLNYSIAQFYRQYFNQLTLFVQLFGILHVKLL